MQLGAYLSPLIFIDVNIVQILIMLSSLSPFPQPSFSLSLLGRAGLAQCQDLPDNDNVDEDGDDSKIKNDPPSIMGNLEFLRNSIRQQQLGCLCF